MSKKLMLVAAGALSVLAFTALPSVASAGEPILHCTGECTYTVQGTGNSVFSIEGGDTIICTAVTGTGRMTSTTGTTGQTELTFTGCREQNTIFHFQCNTKEKAAGTVTTNTMVTHNIFIDKAAKKPGIMLTGSSVTFICAGGFSTTQVKGDAIGIVENPECNKSVTHHTLDFTATGHGEQTYKQVTEAGATHDLEADTGDDNAGWATAAQTGTGHINYTNPVTLTC